MEFKSVPKAVFGMTELLEKEGKKVFIERTGKMTKELIGVSFITSIRDFEKFLKYRGSADDEINAAFTRAWNILLSDSTARYAIGRPSSKSGEKNPSCLVSIQILQRDVTKVICYFRSTHINEFRHDLARIAERTFKKFGKGKIIFFIGSFHKDIRTD